MAQYARPISTLLSGSWSYSDLSLHEDIDEIIPDGVAYIYSSTDEDECVLALSSVIDPVSSSGHIIRFTARSVNGGKGGENLYVRLYEGDTLRASSAKTTLNRNTLTEYTYTLLPEEADAILDYGNLRIRLHVDAVGSGEEIRIDQMEFEVPDAVQEILLDGTSGAVSSLSGDIKRARKIAGIINAVASIVGNLTIGGQILLNGISSAVSSVVGEFKVTRKIDATASVTSSVLADLILAYSLKGTASAQSALSGKLRIVSEAEGVCQGMRGDGYFLNL